MLYHLKLVPSTFSPPAKGTPKSHCHIHGFRPDNERLLVQGHSQTSVQPAGYLEPASLRLPTHSRYLDAIAHQFRAGWHSPCLPVTSIIRPIIAWEIHGAPLLGSTPLGCHAGFSVFA